VAPGAFPAGISNGFMMARPELPFLGEIIRRLPDYDLSWAGLPYATVSFSTGCHFLSLVPPVSTIVVLPEDVSISRSSGRTMLTRLRFNRTMHATTAFNRTDLRVLCGPGNLHHLSGNVSTPIFNHLGSSSWHSYDAAAIKFLTKPSRWCKGRRKWRHGRHGEAGVLPLVIILASLCATVVVVMKRCARERRHD